MNIDFVFFQNLHLYFNDQVQLLADGGFLRLLTLVLAILEPLVVLWITWQGYRMVTGQSQQRASDFVFDLARLGSIVIVAHFLTQQNETVRSMMDGLSTNLTNYLTGQKNQSIFNQIDSALLTMQQSVNLLNAKIPAQELGLHQMSSSAWMSVVGQGAPSLTLGALLFTCKLALMLAVVLSPIFVLGLLFHTTQALFWTWLRYTLSIIVAWSILLIFGTLILHIVDIYAQSLLNLSNAEATQTSSSLLNSALLQCLLGIMLAILLLSIPKIVLQFFNNAYLPIAQQLINRVSPSLAQLSTTVLPSAASFAPSSHTSVQSASTSVNTQSSVSATPSYHTNHRIEQAGRPKITVILGQGKRGHDKLNKTPTSLGSKSRLKNKQKSEAQPGLAEQPPNKSAQNSESNNMQ